MNLDSTKNQIKDRVSVPEVLGRHGRSAETGNKIHCLCKQHDERTPSCHVYRDHCHCYGCKRNWDVIAIEMEFAGCSYQRAIENLAKDFLGIDIRSQGNSKPRGLTAENLARGKGLLIKTMKSEGVVTTERLKVIDKEEPDDDKRGRGLGTFLRVNCSDEVWEQLRRDAASDGIEFKEGQEVAFRYYSAEGKLFPRMKRRFSFSGKIKQSVSHPRLDSLPDGLPVWEHHILKEDHPGLPLFGLQHLDEIREQGYVILVEGETDVLALRQMGFQALGVPGASISKTIKLSYFKGLEKIYYYKEPGQSGESFEHSVNKRFAKSPLRKILHRIDSPRGIDDPCDLLMKRKNSKKDFQWLIENAQHEPVHANDADGPAGAAGTAQSNGANNGTKQESGKSGKGKKDPLTCWAMASMFLAKRQGGRLVHHRGRFYDYRGGKYRPLENDDFVAEVASFVRHSEPMQANQGFTFGVIFHLKTLQNIPAAKDAPFLIESPDVDVSSLLLAKNGRLSVESLLSGNAALSDHKDDFFSLNCLPYDYIPDAVCPHWEQTISQILTDESQLTALQEWFGYHLVSDVSREKFAMFLGEGGNGKSVVLAVLMAMVGLDNFSSVSLEACDPKRTFPMAQMVNKCANILGDMGEINRVAEGVLKQLVSGDPITIEEKGKDAFLWKPSVKLTFATNTLPRFIDRSDGLWRRLLLFTFNMPKLPDSQADTRLRKPKFWLNESGEMPGILNWAIEGLKRLEAKGEFTPSAAMEEAKSDFAMSANPAAEFLTLHVETRQGIQLASSSLYLKYSDWARNNGYSPLGQQQFSKEVNKSFPTVQATPNPRRQPDGTRCRNWIGITFIEDPFDD